MLAFKNVLFGFETDRTETIERKGNAIIYKEIYIITLAIGRN